jgi:N-methylhydantoinase A
MAQFEREGSPTDTITVEREISVRYRRQAHTLAVTVDAGALTSDSAQVIQSRFERRYATVYGEGALLTGAAIELEAQLTNGRREVPPPPLPEHPLTTGDGSHAITHERDACFAPRGFASTPVYDGHALRAGEVVAGPAIIQRMGDSVVVPDAFTAHVDRFLSLELRAA